MISIALFVMEPCGHTDIKIIERTGPRAGIRMGVPVDLRCYYCNRHVGSMARFTGNPFVLVAGMTEMERLALRARWDQTLSTKLRAGTMNQ